MIKKIFFISVFVISILGRTYGEDFFAKQFEDKYQLWKKYLSSPEVALSSRSYIFYDCQEFKEIIKLGIPALPYIIEKTKSDNLIGVAVNEIAKVKFNSLYNKEKNIIEFPDYPDLKPGENIYLYWWNNGRSQTPQRFAALYSDWKKLKTEGKETEAAQVYQKIKDLGIDALPLIVEKMEAGEDGLNEAFSYLADEPIKKEELDQHPKEKHKELYRQWWSNNKDKWTIPAAQ